MRVHSKEGGGGRKLMIKPTSSSPLLPPGPVLVALFAFLCSSAHLSSLFPLPPSLRFQGPDWLTSNLSSQPSFQDYFKNLLPQSISPWSSLKKWGGGKGVCGGGRLNTVECQGFFLSPALLAICPPHSFSSCNGNSFVWRKLE